MLETYTPEVTKAYITSRLESVHIILRYEKQRDGNTAAAGARMWHRRL